MRSTAVPPGNCTEHVSNLNGATGELGKVGVVLAMNASVFPMVGIVSRRSWLGATLNVMPPNWNDGSASFHLGQCYFALEDYARAVQAHKDVARAYGVRYRARALFQLAEAHLALGHYGEARRAYYALLLNQDRYGSQDAELIETAYYRIADCYWRDAEALGHARRGRLRASEEDAP